MGTGSSSPTKITRPVFGGILHRIRLVRILERARKKPVIFISAPAGSGKTTLVASYIEARKNPCIWFQCDRGDSDPATFFYYLRMAASKAAPRRKTLLPLLTPEYFLNITTFTKRFFRDFFSRLKYGSLVVFDNYQELGEREGIHQIIRDGLDEVPEGISVVLISRHDLPVELARFRITEKLAALDADLMKLTFEESRGIAKLRKKKKASFSKNSLRMLHDLSEGWAAGLTLMIEEGFQPEIAEKHPQSKEAIFNYFAGEIYKKLDRKTRNFLLKTSFLSHVDPRLAGEITGNTRAGYILSSLLKNNYFIEKRSANPISYHYHQLFREFLVDKALRTFPDSEIRALHHAIAGLLMESGRQEEAVEHFEISGDLKGLASAALKLAPVLLANARVALLSEIIDKIPREIREQNTWLIYWQGVCRLAVNPSKSLHYFENAFPAFRASGLMDGAYLTLAGAVSALIQLKSGYEQIDPWIDRLDELESENPSGPSGQVRDQIAVDIFFALVLRRHDHPRFPKWRKFAFNLLASSYSFKQRLSSGWRFCFYHIWMGEYRKAFDLIDSLRKEAETVPYADLDLIMILAADQMASWQAGLSERSFKAADNLKRIADKSGIPFWNIYRKIHCIGAAITEGDMAKADKFLKETQEVISAGDYTDKALFHNMACWLALINENVHEASIQGRSAIEYSYKANTYLTIAIAHYGTAMVHIKSGDYENAGKQLGKMKQQGRPVNNKLVEFVSLLARAWIELKSEKEKTGVKTLEKAMKTGRENDFVNFFFFMPEMVSELCGKALERGIEAEYVKSLIKRRHLIPAAHSLQVEEWPWPVMIYTTGRFEIIKSGKPLAFSGKVPKKPLELLKAIIAFGGRDVSRDRVTDALWPESEGYAAHKSFEAALHRLRKILGSDDAVILSEGKLSLDRRICWVER